MSFTREVYAFSSEYIGLEEISGPKDNRMIEVAHRLCRVEGDKGGNYTDEIPWCSSWLVLCVVCVNIRRNPKAAFDIIVKRGIPLGTIKEIFVFAKVDWDMRLIDTKVPFVHPTWSASSKSWDNWGYEVQPHEARRGDFLRLTRDGGGHITQLDEDKLGLLWLKCLGGNQSNKVNSSNSYLRTRLVHIRRAEIDFEEKDQYISGGTVRKGDKGIYVSRVQKALVAKGFQLKVDGDFGPQTEGVVRAFQKLNKLKVDGIVGPKTWVKLN